MAKERRWKHEQNSEYNFFEETDLILFFPYQPNPFQKPNYYKNPNPSCFETVCCRHRENEGGGSKYV
jgi:hypothetical protein